MITVEGSREYMTKIFKNWEWVDSCIKELKGSVTLSEGEQLRFDAQASHNGGDFHFLILAENPENVRLLAQFAKAQSDAWKKHVEIIRLIIRTHSLQASNTFSNSNAPQELIREYKRFMQSLVQCMFSSIIKSLTLLDNEKLLFEFKKIKEAANRLKIDLTNSTRLEICAILIDNL